MAMSFPKWLTLFQVIQTLENVRRDIRNNTAFAQANIGNLPFNSIVNVHLQQNAVAFDRLLIEVKALYDDVGRKAALDDALTSLGFSLSEGIQSYQALRGATNLILNTTYNTEADINSVADNILLPTGSDYVEAHDSLWG